MQRERPGELEGVEVWEMGLGVASIKFPVGSDIPLQTELQEQLWGVTTPGESAKARVVIATKGHQHT